MLLHFKRLTTQWLHCSLICKILLQPYRSIFGSWGPMSALGHKQTLYGYSEFVSFQTESGMRLK